MYPLNLFTLSRVEDANTFFKFAKQLSRRQELLKVREHEMLCIIGLVKLLLQNGAVFETLITSISLLKFPKSEKNLIY